MSQDLAIALIALRILLATLVVCCFGLRAASRFRKQRGAEAESLGLRATLVTVGVVFLLCLVPLPRLTFCGPAVPSGTWRVSRPDSPPPSTTAPGMAPDTAAPEWTPDQPPSHFAPLKVAVLGVGTIWAIGAVGLAIYQAVGIAYLLRFYRRRVLVPRDSDLSRWLAETHAAHGSRRPLPLLALAPGLASPFLMDLPGLPPTLFLPRDAETRFTPETLCAIFAHELNHAERRDCAWLLGARLLCCLLWPNPLLWRIQRRLEANSELLSDRAALAGSVCAPRAYADCLLTLSQATPPPRGFPPHSAGTAAIVSPRSVLEERIRRIMQPDNDRPATRRDRLALAAGSVLLLAACVAVFGTSRPAIETTPAFAQDAAPNLPSITLDLQDTPIQQALEQLATSAKLKLVIDASAPNPLPGFVNMRITETPCDKAAKLIVRSAGRMPGKALRSQIRDGVLTISAIDVDKRNLPAARRSVRYYQVWADKALQDLLTPYGFTVRFSETMNWRVTLRQDNTPVGDIFEAILKQGPERVQYGVTLPDEITISLPVVPKETQVPVTPITVDFKDLPLRKALERMLQAAHCDFSIAPDIEGTVTYACTNKPLVNALKEIMAVPGISPLKIISVNGVIVVKRAEW